VEKPNLTTLGAEGHRAQNQAEARLVQFGLGPAVQECSRGDTADVKPLSFRADVVHPSNSPGLSRPADQFDAP
jgi:hypothetical protein